MKSDQELFAKGLATYQKVVAANYMAHREVHDILRRVLLDEAADGFVFADLACGTAPRSAAALAGSNVSRYVGIDISQPSLDVAKEALAALTCPVELRCEDFVVAIDSWKGPLGVVWIGQSLHHLLAQDKVVWQKSTACRQKVVFLIWEPTCLEGGTAMDGTFHQMRLEWAAISTRVRRREPLPRRLLRRPRPDWHGPGCWLQNCEQLMMVPNKLARVYRFRH